MTYFEKVCLAIAYGIVVARLGQNTKIMLDIILDDMFHWLFF